MSGLRSRAAVVACILILLAPLAACTPPAALHTLTQQNVATLQAYTANVSVLTSAARDLARTQTSALVQRARERTATDLIRLRATIAPTDPTDADLADTTAAWTISLSAEAATLAARLNIARPDQRPALGASLADDHPATIDLALATPGFAPARILRDAVALDNLNSAILAEPNPDLRAALHASRNALLDAYLPARTASDLANRYLAAVNQLITATDQQAQALGLYAQAADTYAAGPPPGAALLTTFQSPDLRTAALDLIAHTSGQPTAERIRSSLTSIDQAITAISSLNADQPR